MNAGTFVCARCGGTFEQGDPATGDAEALAIWGIPGASHHPEMAQICDECFARVKPTRRIFEDNPELYTLARDLCHDYGLDWTDPRTGVTHPAPIPRGPIHGQ